MNDDEARRLLFPAVGVRFEDEETWSFNTHDWPRAPLILVSAACGRRELHLTPDEVMEMTAFLGRMQARLTALETA